MKIVLFDNYFLRLCIFKKNHRPLSFYPFVGVTSLNRLTCHLGYWVASLT